MYTKKLIALLLIISSCNQHAPTAKQEKNDTVTVQRVHADTDQAEIRSVTDNLLILPGQRIGQTPLNGNIDSVIKLLGKPDESDAGMGKAMYTWFADHNKNGHRVSVFIAHNMGNSDEAIGYIKAVYITSPSFKTRESIGAGTSLTTISTYYDVKKAGVYNSGKDSITLYEDLSKGISFELGKDDKCRGILIYAPGDKTHATMSFHPSMGFTPAADH